MKVVTNPITEAEACSEQFMNIETKTNTNTPYIKIKTTKIKFTTKNIIFLMDMI